MFNKRGNKGKSTFGTEQAKLAGSGVKTPGTFLKIDSKKGIAPLVATLLLISFAVSLGVVIMNFGRAQVELQAQCPVDIDLKLSEIGGKKQACLDGKTISFTVENGANMKVTGLVVNVIGSKKAETKEFNTAIDKVGTFVGSMPYDAGVSGTIRQLKITPKIKLAAQEEICIEKSLVIESVTKC
jgi:flagellin-like protein